MKTVESPRLTQGLDYYKALMAQVEFEKHPDAIVTFELINRGSNKLSEFVSPEELRTRLDELRDGWGPDEIAYLASLNHQDGNAVFNKEYLDFLMDNVLPEVEIYLDDDGELAVKTTGPWPLVTFWETVVMSVINEIYFANKLAAEGGSLDDLYEKGDQILSEKIARLKKRTDIKLSDFGTRRRFSYTWQKHVMERLINELPDNLLGTSNIYLARLFDVPPIGTNAHETMMVYAGLEDEAGNDPLDGHGKFQRDWRGVYGDNLSVVLTDTYTTEFFFADLTPDQIRHIKGYRHDSGDPFKFGDRLIDFLETNGIDPTTRTIVFSDNLDIDKIFGLADYFKGKINYVFGWGTTLMNDLGVTPNNFVMKATNVNGVDTVKLSDAEGKHMGPPDLVEKYQQRVEIRIGIAAMKSLETAKEMAYA